MPNITQNYLATDFIRKIGTVRGNIGKSQEEISRLLGITRQTLSGLENQRLEDREGARSELKFTNILSLAALYDFYAASSTDVKEELDAQEFQIFETEYLDQIFFGQAPTAETLCEAWLRKRSILEGEELKSMLISSDALDGSHIFFDVYSFYKRNEFKLMSRQLSNFCLRIEKMNKCKVHIYLDDRIQTESLYQVPEINRFLQDMVALKEKGSLVAEPISVQAGGSYDDVVIDYAKKKGLLDSAKKPFLISDSVHTLLKTHKASVTPAFLTSSGMMIDAGSLSYQQKRALRKGQGGSYMLEEEPHVVQSLFEK